MPLNGAVMSARRRMLFNGVVVASLAVDEAGRLRGRPRVSAPGLFDLQPAAFPPRDANEKCIRAAAAGKARGLGIEKKPLPCIRNLIRCVR